MVRRAWLLAAVMLPQTVDPGEIVPFEPAPGTYTTPARAVRVPAAPLPAVDSAPVRTAYRDDMVLVRPTGSLDALAAAWDSRVATPVGRSGFGALRVPDGTDARAFSSVLAGDPQVAAVAPMGVVTGTGKPTAGKGGRTDRASRTTEEPTPGEVLRDGTGGVGAVSSGSRSVSAPSTAAPWHRQLVNAPDAGRDLSAVVVAVLDSGVAYEDRSDATGVYAAAPGLSGLSIVAPADFVNGDTHAGDDHQHGTHIASVIAASADACAPGIGAGVALMPVKVLDATNTGTEWALVEGIHHAVDHGAHVVNMSLSFHPDYVPSLALRAALERAWDAGVVMVAASGNTSAAAATWPAASRTVVAVGASRSDARGVSDPHTAYSNRGPALDLLAPGGSLELDADLDGVPDGIVAETIYPNDPSRIGLWLYEGTSQAAAIASGAAAHLVADGVPPHDVALRLQLSQASGFEVADALASGTGAGVLDVARARGAPSDVTHEDLYVGLLPYVRDLGEGMIQPSARVVVIDDAGDAVAGATVLATVRDAGGVRWLQCDVNASTGGSCTLDDLAVPDRPTSADAWLFSVDAIVIGGFAHRPSRAVFLTDGSEVLFRALEDAGMDPALLAIYWNRDEDPVLGPLMDGYSVVDTGTGLLSSPLGLTFRTWVAYGSGSVQPVEVDVDGTGLLSSPLGLKTTVRLVRLDGTAGGASVELVAVDGTGLLSSPLGFHATDFYAFLGGTGLLSSPLGFRGEPLLLDTTRAIGTSTDGTLYGEIAGSGGWTSPEGHSQATLLVGSGAVHVGDATVY